MKLLNDIKQLVLNTATAVKEATRRAWKAAVALLHRVRQAAAEKVTAVQTAAADWWLANRTPIVAFVVVYALALLFALGAMVYAFSLERRAPEVKAWVDALFAGQLRFPGWQLTVTHIGLPTLIDLPVPATA